MTLLLGWIGAFCFSACAIPQTIKCMKQGHARGLSPWFLWLWFGGEIFYGLAVYLEFGWILWMQVNYILNIICILVIFRYYFWPTRPTLEQIISKHWTDKELPDYGLPGDTVWMEDDE